MAFCGKCGKQIADGVKFCDGCGSPVGVAAGGFGGGMQGMPSQGVPNNQGMGGGSYSDQYGNPYNNSGSITNFM